MNKRFKILLKTPLFLFLLLITFNKVEAKQCSNPQINYEFSTINFISVQSHVVDIEIKSASDISVDERISVINVNDTIISELDFLLKHPYISDPILEDDAGNEPNYFTTSFPNNTRIITISDLNLEKGQTYSFNVFYTFENELHLQKGKPSFYIFYFKSTCSYNTSYHRVKVLLPTKSDLHLFQGGNPPPFYPESGIATVVGEFIDISWEYDTEIKHHTDKEFTIYFDKPPDMIPSVWIIVVGPVSGIILGGTGVYWWMKRRERRAIESIGKVFLTDDQKLILNHILENEGKLTQKGLIELTKFTKSKLSRNLIPLEEYGLIKKEKWGREFKVFITESGRKMAE